MKNMIKVLGIIVILTAIGIPLFAQAPAPSEAIEILQPRPNNVNNLLHKSFTGGKHFFRVNNLTDSFYYIMWRDSDDNRNLRGIAANIWITIVNITTNRVIAVEVDYAQSYNEEGLANAIEITRGVHYNSGDSILIIVEGENYNPRGGSSYAILVY